LSSRDDLLEFSLIIIKCFVILLFFGFILPKLVDNLMFFFHKSDMYDNSIFVSYVVDKNSKLLYNYIYILKLIISAS
jgi:hypothetical protein